MEQEATNTGYYISHEPEASGEDAFFLVLGSPRGGTTLLIHSLARLGIFIGEKVPFTGEDPFLAQYLAENNRLDLRSRLRNRSETWHKHAWKFPQILHQPQVFEDLPPSTRIILVFRDPVATGIRGTKATKQPFLSELESALDYQTRMLNLAKSFPGPILYLSYEKILSNPGLLSKALAEFTEITEQSRLVRVVEGVRPSPDFYVQRDSEWKRKARSKGLRACLDHLDDQVIRGWAYFSDDYETSVELEIEWENGPTLATKADLMRMDLKESGLHPTGKCGFQLPLTEQSLPQPGDLVHIRESKTGMEFEGSPFLFSASFWKRKSAIS